MKQFIAEKVTIENTQHGGKTALIHAAENGHRDCCEALVRESAERAVDSCYPGESVQQLYRYSVGW